MPTCLSTHMLAHMPTYIYTQHLRLASGIAWHRRRQRDQGCVHQTRHVGTGFNDNLPTLCRKCEARLFEVRAYAHLCFLFCLGPLEQNAASISVRVYDEQRALSSLFAAFRFAKRTNFGLSTIFFCLRRQVRRYKGMPRQKRTRVEMENTAGPGPPRVHLTPVRLPILAITT